MSRRPGSLASRDLRFFLDNDVDHTLRRVLRRAGHDCWAASDAHLALESDQQIAVYADQHQAAVITHDIEFTARQRERTIGQHVRLCCHQADAVALVKKHLDEMVSILTNIPSVVIELRPDSVRFFHGKWPD